MPTPVPRDASFPMAHCAECDKSVLTYVALDDDGVERRVCVHCDSPISDGVSWVGPGDLEQSGYYFGPPPAENETGCSSGCGSCAVKKH
jgi:hypothetical protein